MSKPRMIGGKYRDRPDTAAYHVLNTLGYASDSKSEARAKPSLPRVKWLEREPGGKIARRLLKKPYNFY